MRNALAAIAIFLAGAVSAGAVEPDPAQLREHAIAGRISPSAKESRFLTIGAIVRLDIDSGLVVKGDRLDIYEYTGDDGEPARFGRVGQMIALSSSHEAPTGMVNSVLREIGAAAYLGFALPRDIQLNRYLPFMQSMADTFLDRPFQRLLNVAPLDVVNPYGDITVASEKIDADLKRLLCARPQFRCVDENSVAAVLRKQMAITSRGVDAIVEGELFDRAGVDVYVTGHYRRVGRDVELILRARSTRSETKPAQTWRRFIFSAEELGVEFPAGEKVTVSHRSEPRGRLHVALVDAMSMEGRKAEHFFYEDVSSGQYVRAAGDTPVEPAGFYMKIGGRMYTPDDKGTLFDGALPARTHNVIIGYRVTGGGMNASIERAIEISIGRGKRYALDVAGAIRRGYAFLIAGQRVANDSGPR